MLTSDDKKMITQWCTTHTGTAHIGLALTADSRSDALRTFCDHLARLAPQLRVKKLAADESLPPAIHINKICYQAIPVGPELKPFLNILAGDNRPAKALSPSIQAQLVKVDTPAPLKIYISPQCPFCPQTEAAFTSLSLANPLIQPTVIDGTLFSELAAADQIKSAPTLILDDKFRWSGSIQVPEVLNMIITRDPAQLSTSALRSMFEDGKAADVAALMIERQKVFPSFLELLTHVKWPVRLAAMVAFETMADADQALTAQCIAQLWENFPNADDHVQGDLLYLFGKSGLKAVIPKLESVLSGPYPTEVKEAAQEALRSLN